MRNEYFKSFAAAVLAAGILTACQSSAGSQNGNIEPQVNYPVSKANVAPSPAESPKQIPDVNSDSAAATPTEAYKAAHAARKNKDVQALKKLLSKDILEFLTMIGEAENKTLDQALTDLAEKPQADNAEARNEKVSGDTATVEYKDEKGQWKTMDFVKEDGQWKLTIPKADSPMSGRPDKKR